MNREEALKLADTLQVELADMAYGMAVRLHREVGQTYDGLPYAETHSAGVRDVLAQFGYTSPFWQIVAMLHDVPEDCLKHLTPMQRALYLARLYGEVVAHVVWCVSGFGEKRSIRNADIKAKIVADTTGLSPILKCADRIFNVRHARGGLLEMYWNEMPDFETYIRPHVPEAMWQELLDTFARVREI